MLMIMVRILTNFFEIAENGEEVGRGRMRAMCFYGGGMPHGVAIQRRKRNPPTGVPLSVNCADG